MNLFSKKVVGIDFHDYSAQLVELMISKKEVSLEAYNRIVTPSNVIKEGEVKDPETFRNILSSLMKNANPKEAESKRVAVIFPARKTFVHIFKFPANLAEADVKKAIPYEAETIIPFSIGDVYWDFSVLEREDPKKPHATQHVMFAAVPKGLVDQYTQVLESIGLVPFLFGIHAESLEFALQKQLNPDRTSLIIEFGALSTNYITLRNHTIKHYFSSNHGGADLIAELEKEFDVEEGKLIEMWQRNKLEALYLPTIKTFIEKNYKLAQNIMRDNQDSLDIGPADDIFLTGEFLNLPHFFELAKLIFPNQNVEVGDPKMGLNIDVSRFLPLIDQKHEPVPYSTYFCNAIGVALRGLTSNGNGRINLLPDRLKETFTNRKQAFIAGIISLGMCVLSLFMSTVLFFQHQELSYGRVNLEIEKSAVEKTLYGTRYQEIRDSTTEFNNELVALSNIDHGLFSVPNVLTDIHGLLPEGVTLTALRFNDTDLSIMIMGIASTRDSLLETQRNFESAEFVSEVVAPISNFDSKTQISFSMEIYLEFTQLPRYASASDSQ